MPGSLIPFRSICILAHAPRGKKYRQIKTFSRGPPVIRANAKDSSLKDVICVADDSPRRGVRYEMYTLYAYKRTTLRGKAGTDHEIEDEAKDIEEYFLGASVPDSYGPGFGNPGRPFGRRGGGGAPQPATT